MAKAAKKGKINIDRIRQGSSFHPVEDIAVVHHAKQCECKVKYVPDDLNP